MLEKSYNPAGPGSSAGSLTVQVAESESAVPIPGAQVTVTKENGDGISLQGTLITDRSGLAGPIFLPAPPAEASLSPSLTLPYEIYYVEISHPGYYTEQNHMVQIFGDSASHLIINLIPLPEYPGKGVIMY